MHRSLSRALSVVVALTVPALFAAEAPAGKKRPGKDRAKAAKNVAKADPQQLGDYVWGARIAQADTEGRVLVCCVFDGEDRTAPQLPKMVLSELKTPNPNVALMMVLADGGALTKALRILSEAEVKLPVISDATIPDLANVRVPRPRAAGGRGKAGARAQFCIYARAPDGKLIYSGAIEPAKLQTVLADIAKAAAEFPTCLTRGKSFPRSSAIVRQLATAGSYGAIVQELTRRAAGKDAAEAQEARDLLANLEDQGTRLLRKGAYFEKRHLPTALETYAAIAKSWKGLPAGAKAEERLAALKAEKTLEHELAAVALADRIRQDCALLVPAPKAPNVVVRDPECQDVASNKNVIARLLGEAAIFRSKYKDARIAPESQALLRAYGVPDTPAAK